MDERYETMCGHERLTSAGGKALKDKRGGVKDSEEWDEKGGCDNVRWMR